MVKFAETAIINYRLSFADQGKQRFYQTEICRFRLPFAEKKWKLPFSDSSLFHLWNSGNLETWRHQQGNESPSDFP
jgi:hypothetical protein